MRNTAVRLAMTLPQGYTIRWPHLCSVCGSEDASARAAAARQAPAVPYCSSCMSIHRRWTTWITLWLGVGLTVLLGPLLYLGITLDRPVPTMGLYHHYGGLIYIDLTFFAIILSAIAAGIGYFRRSELQGVQVQEIRTVVDDPDMPLDSGESFMEVRFKNRDFYSATLDANRG